MSPKITKLYIERGKTVQVDDKTWDKQTIGLEADVSDIQDETQLEKLRQDLWTKEGDWIEEHVAKPTVPEPIKSEDIPDLDIGEINDCVWTRYGKNKGSAKPGHAGWTKNPVQFVSEDFPKALSQFSQTDKKESR